MDHHRFRLLNLKLGLTLSLLAGIIYRTHSSSYSESPIYIAEAYFHDHETLIDQAFQNFIANGLPHTSCEIPQFVLKLSLFERQLIGEGSHRRLTSSFKIKTRQEILSCEAIIIERLPPGVFADPFELQHLTQRGVFSDASVFGDTDLELPTVRANRSIVEIHMYLSTKNNNELEFKIDLPLHARYAPLGEGGYTRIEFGTPDLFTRCIMEHNKSCIFQSTNDDVTITSNLAPILWEVPSGITKHTKIVSFVTFISAIVSAFSIFMACLYYSNTQSYSSFKQS